MIFLSRQGEQRLIISVDAMQETFGDSSGKGYEVEPLLVRIAPR